MKLSKSTSRGRDSELAAQSSVESDVQRILPPHTSRPGDVPDDIFRCALRMFLAKKKLDMRAIANSLGISRVTLYRKAGQREALLGEVLWAGTRQMIAQAIREAGTLQGAVRILAFMEHFMRAVVAHEALRFFLASEPQCAIRILTSKYASVQQQVTDAVKRFLELEQERGHFSTSMNLAELAYAMVRIAEGYVYADAIADLPPNVDAASLVIARLLGAERTISRTRRATP